MDTSMFLSNDEVVALTHRRQWSAQVKMLRAMGIEHRVRGDGTVVVLTRHVEQVLGGKQAPVEKPRTEPNWRALEQFKEKRKTASRK
jgi:hypothetical protein